MSDLVQIRDPDLKFFLSGAGNNANPFDSYGGPISTVEVVDDVIDNMFSSIYPAESIQVGFTDYRCIYVKNTSDTETKSNIHVYWAIEDSHVSAEITHRGVNHTVERLTSAYSLQGPGPAEIGTEPETATSMELVTPYNLYAPNSTNNIIDKGGLVCNTARVKVHVIFWGNNWPDLPEQATISKSGVTNKLTTLLNYPNYFSQLYQYRAIRPPILGTIATNTTVNVPASDTYAIMDFLETYIKPVITDSIDRGLVPEGNDVATDTIYAVIVPDELTACLFKPDPNQDEVYFCYGGTHMYDTYNGKNYLYLCLWPPAADVYYDYDKQTHTAEDWLIQAFTHELVDAMSDSMWNGQQAFVWRVGGQELAQKTIDENGNLGSGCGDAVNLPNGLFVETYYSDVDGRCVAPGKDTGLVLPTCPPGQYWDPLECKCKSGTSTDPTPAGSPGVNQYGIMKVFADPITGVNFFKDYKNNGEMGDVNGFRYNWIIPSTVVNTELSAFITITKTSGKDYISLVMGGGKHTDSAQDDGCSYNIGIPFKGQDPVNNLLRKECPHPNYHSCANVTPLFDLPDITDKEIGVIGIKCNEGNGNVYIACYINQTPTREDGSINNDTWQKYMEYHDSGQCYEEPYQTPHGDTRQEIIRIDLADYHLRFGSVREIIYNPDGGGNPPPPPIQQCNEGFFWDQVTQTCLPIIPEPPVPQSGPWKKLATNYNDTFAIIPELKPQEYIAIWLRRIIGTNAASEVRISSTLMLECNRV